MHFFSLFHGEPAGLLHCLRELLPHLVPGGVGRQVQPVEARVGLGQVLGGRVDQVQGEQTGASGACRALEGLEALETTKKDLLQWVQL